MLNRSGPSAELKVVSEGIYRSTCMSKLSSPGTVSAGISNDPGQGALTSPHGLVPLGSQYSQSLRFRDQNPQGQEQW